MRGTLKKLTLPLYILALVAVFSWAFESPIYISYSTSLNLDEALNLQVAENLKAHRKYGSNAQEPLVGPRQNYVVKLDPIVTTGPATLLPAALPYLLFGADLGSSGRAVILWFLFAGFLCAPLLLLARTGSPLAALLGMAAAGWLLKDWWWCYWFICILGEGPGFAYFASGVALFFGALELARPGGKIERQLGFLAGALIGLSLLCKFNLLIPMAGLSCFLLFELTRNRNDGRLRAALPRLLIGALGVIALWHLYQIVSVGPREYIWVKKQFFRLLKNLNGGAVPQMALFGPEWRAGVLARAGSLGQVLASSWLLLAASSIGILLGALELFRQRRRISAAWLAMITAGVPCAIWFVFLSGGGVVRHVLPGATLITIGSAGILFEKIGRRMRAMRFVTADQTRKAVAWSVASLGLVMGLQLGLAEPMLDRKAHPAKTRYMAEVERAYKPHWLGAGVPVPQDDTLPYDLFLEVGVTPFSLRWLKNACESEHLKFAPDETYALLNPDWLRRKSEPFWQCKSELPLPEPRVAFQDYFLQLCKGSELVCAPALNRTPASNSPKR